MRDSGISLATTTNNGRWIGWIVGVGEGVTDLKFGDIVELSKWAWTEGQWIAKPAEFLFRLRKDLPVNGFWWESEDGTKRIQGSWQDVLAVLCPDDLLFKHASWDFAANGPDSPLSIQPIGDRILIELRRPHEKIGSFYDPRFSRLDWESVGTAIRKGSSVKDVEIGDVVCIEPAQGTRIKLGDDRWLALVRERHIDSILSELPSEGSVVVYRQRETA